MDNLLFHNLIKKSIVGQVTAIFFIQVSSATAFAVFFSGLSLYLTQNKYYTTASATVMTGLFLSLHYFLPLIGGVFANRIISYKKLYCLGAAASFTGCLFLAYDISLYVGLALFLMSSLVTNVCLNMFITKLFREAQHTERRIAFIWNYVGMNLGFLLGGFLTGYYAELNSYTHLFLIMSVLVVLSLMLAAKFIKYNDLDFDIGKSNTYQLGLTLFLMSALVVSIVALFIYSDSAQEYMTILSFVVLGALIHYGYRKSGGKEQKKYLQFFCYSGLSIVFWTVYMLTPTAFMQIIQSDVQKTIFGITLAPQWFVNIDSVVILLVAPQLAFTLRRQRNKNVQPLAALRYFSYGFMFCSAAFLVFLLGLYMSSGKAVLPMWAMLGYLVMVTIGDIFISPIGNSLIGELIPSQMRGLMTGVWSMNVGIGGLLSSIIATHYILPCINEGGLVGSSLVDLKRVILVISITLILLTLLMFMSGRIKKEVSGVYSAARND